MSADESIFALATGAGPAAIAVIRVSGAAAGEALSRLTGRPPPPPRQVRRARLRDETKQEQLDDALIIWLPRPASYTGEDMAEFHIHGGAAVVAGVVDVLSGVTGLRPAEPGEFTRRAFESGKLDLTEAEGIADLIDAETAAQRRQALRQMGGALTRLYQGWSDRLVALLARIEAEIDFPDEELPEGLVEQAVPALRALQAEIDTHLADDRRGERLREGLYVAIVGAPNVGKSSLLNALAGRDAAIVAATAGTTRDVVEVHMDIAGYPVILADTAGLREASDAVEIEGVRRARDRAEGADLRLAVFDAAAAPVCDAATLALIDDTTICVLNKIDTVSAPPRNLPLGGTPVAVSALTGAGLEAMERALETELAARWRETTAPVITRARHRAALVEGRDALIRAVAAPLPELVAEDVRLAVRSLGRITGAVDVEDLLDVIFRDFCIGK